MTNTEFLNNHKDKPVRVHWKGRSHQGILRKDPFNPANRWFIFPDIHTRIEFTENDIFEWDITCNDLIPEIHLKLLK